MQQKNNSNLVMVYELECLFKLLNRIVFVVFCCITRPDPEIISKRGKEIWLKKLK